MKHVRLTGKLSGALLEMPDAAEIFGQVWINYSPGDVRKDHYRGSPRSLVGQLNKRMQLIRNNGLSPEIVAVHWGAIDPRTGEAEYLEESEDTDAIEQEAAEWIQPPGVGHNFNESLQANLSWEERLHYGVPMTLEDKSEAVRAGIPSHEAWMGGAVS